MFINFTFKTPQLARACEFIWQVYSGMILQRSFQARWMQVWNMTHWDLTKKEATSLVECLEFFVLFLNVCKLGRVTIVRGSHLNHFFKKNTLSWFPGFIFWPCFRFTIRKLLFPKLCTLLHDEIFFKHSQINLLRSRVCMGSIYLYIRHMGAINKHLGAKD